MRKILPFVCLFLLNGCATHLSQQQCATGNWQNAGYVDGIGGRPSNLTNFTEDCAKFNIPVNGKQYIAGWKQGIRSYCTPDSNTGFQIGNTGNPRETIYNRQSVCASGGEQLNLSAYFTGWEAGKNQYCNNTQVAYDLGARNAPYPAMCSPYQYVDFKNSFDRGFAQYQLEQTQQKIDEMNQKAAESQARLNDINQKLDQSQQKLNNLHR